MRKTTPFVVLGAGENANKAILSFKSKKLSGYELHICELEKEEVERGSDDFDIEDISKDYMTIYLCKKESVQAMIDILQKTLDMWE